MSRRLDRYKRPLLYVMSSLYLLAGVAHFLAPKSFERAVPPQFPRPLELVYLSGIAEIALGIGVLYRRTRGVSAWGIVALLIAVFPANVHIATSDVLDADLPPRFARVARLVALVRLPFQAVLIAWAWWYTKPIADSQP
ncbi:hypothetical protein OB919_07575 [Halobacteria archaeon AArc-curdl1]|uniref:DoxX family membrane protein n=2 Tax=Natronosalvus hydrolyticus TaxID=2979988 RepID=A0AAP3E6H7_9EURY|nr:hypothetical protein [Halobacteria archaeon AArc-curdl1]